MKKWIVFSSVWIVLGGLFVGAVALTTSCINDKYEDEGAGDNTIICRPAYQDFSFNTILRCHDILTGKCYLVGTGSANFIAESPCPEAER